MSRIRTVKPELFRHEELFDAELASGLPLRLAFIGLLTAADCEGRFQWKPRTLKLDVLPHDVVDFAAVLAALEQHGFIRSYVVDGAKYGLIPSFKKHQRLQTKETEAGSRLPEPPAENSQLCPICVPGVSNGKTRCVPERTPMRTGKHPDAYRKASGTQPESQEEEEEEEKEKERNEKTFSPDGEKGDACAPPSPAAPRVIVLDHPPYASIVALYHEVLPELRECRVITPGRRGYMRQRCPNKPGPDLAAWRRYFEYVRTCPFLMGKAPGRDGRPPFMADLEWLIRPENFAKVIEGKFEMVARHG